MSAIIQTNTIPYRTSGNRVYAGDVVRCKNLIGVCAADANYEAETRVFVSGVFSVPKDDSNISYGDYVYYNESKCECTLDKEGNMYMGLAVQDADSDDDTVMVLINYPKCN